MPLVPIEDDVMDCPMYGVMSSMRCVRRCPYFVRKDEKATQCRFGMPDAQGAAEEQASQPERVVAASAGAGKAQAKSSG